MSAPVSTAAGAATSRGARRMLPPVVALLAALSVVAPGAQAQRERYAPLVLQLPVTARTMALGGLSMATRDVEAVFGNPALVGGANAMSLSLGRYASGASTGHAATATTIGPLGVGFGVGFLDAPQYLSVRPVRSDVLTVDGDRAASNLAAGVAAGLSWKGFRWGLGARFVEERVAAARGGSVSADVGMSRDFLNGFLTTGLVVQHIGRGPGGPGASDPLPSRVSLGAATSAYGLSRWFDVGGAANVAVRWDGRVVAALGGELVYVPIEGIALALRAGGRAPELRAQRPLTGGVGVSYDRLTVDYGWEDMRGKGGAHRVTLRVR